MAKRAVFARKTLDIKSAAGIIDCAIVRLCDCAIVRLCDCAIVRLCDCGRTAPFAAYPGRTEWPHPQHGGITNHIQLLFPHKTAPSGLVRRIFTAGHKRRGFFSYGQDAGGPAHYKQKEGDVL